MCIRDSHKNYTEFGEPYQLVLPLNLEGLVPDDDSVRLLSHELEMCIRDRIISRDALKTAQLLCNGAIEARVLGLSRPAMSITGSGAHGIIDVYKRQY